MKQINYILLIIFSVFITSCYEKKTEDPIKCYTYWAGQKPPVDIKVIHGKYWQSAHWSKEYISYLEIQATKEWREEFIKQNSLIKDNEKFILPDDAPEWFRLNEKFKSWKINNEYQQSRFYIDTISNKIFLYEIQL